MNYEFHITPAISVNLRRLNEEIFSFGEGTPILGVSNLHKDGTPNETVWMTAERASLTGGHSAALYYLANCQNRQGWRRYSRYEPQRMKIKVEYSLDFDPQDFLYIETHFRVTPGEAEKLKVGISRNVITGELIATERCYLSNKFQEFAQTQISLGRKVELCLFDTNVHSDKGWVLVPKKDVGVMSPKAKEQLREDYLKLFVQGVQGPKGKTQWEVS